MSDERKPRGGWRNPASAANGQTGGRPREKAPTFRRGERLIIHRCPLDGVAPEEAGIVLSVGEHEIEVQIGNDILVLRRPDPGE